MFKQLQRSKHLRLNRGCNFRPFSSERNKMSTCHDHSNTIGHSIIWNLLRCDLQMKNCGAPKVKNSPNCASQFTTVILNVQRSLDLYMYSTYREWVSRIILYISRHVQCYCARGSAVNIIMRCPVARQPEERVVNGLVLMFSFP